MKHLRVDNRVLRRLPLDREPRNFLRQVPMACYSRIEALSPLRNPALVALSPTALALATGGSAASLSTAKALEQSLLDAKPNPDGAAQELRQDIEQYLSGSELLSGATPAAHCYCGHQFGSFAGQLGDGAAMYLCEVLQPSSTSGEPDPESEDGRKSPLTRSLVLPSQVPGTERWELQLKGSGKTPYSRFADGRKVLRSSIREFLCSELMAGLGIPTTRAAALVTSDSTVKRDPLYDGRVVDERCTVVARVAESFLRFGSFEISRPADSVMERDAPSAGSASPLLDLYKYIAEEFFTDLVGAAKAEAGEGGSWEEPAAVPIFKRIVDSTAALVAQWRAVGWTHGVLNTDNMSVLGLTIDYGPYGFMEHYDEQYVPNTSDSGGRYSFGNQAKMCKWNLARLAEAWGMLFPSLKGGFNDLVENEFSDAFHANFLAKTRAKLGLPPGVSDETVKQIWDGLKSTLTKTGPSLTMFFGQLATISIPPPPSSGEQELAEDTRAQISAAAKEIAVTGSSTNSRLKTLKIRADLIRPQLSQAQVDEFFELSKTDQEKLREAFFGAPDVESIMMFLDQQAKIIKLRDEAIKERHSLLGGSDEAKQAADAAVWEASLTQYVRAVSKLLHSSDNNNNDNHQNGAQQRINTMQANNPVFVLYPWILQEATDRADAGDYSLVRHLADRVTHPYDPDPRDGVLWSLAVPENYEQICVSCSS